METADQMGDLHGLTLTKGPPCDSLCHYVNAINASPRNIGKEGKFQLFVCLGIRWVFVNDPLETQATENKRLTLHNILRHLGKESTVHYCTYCGFSHQLYTYIHCIIIPTIHSDGTTKGLKSLWTGLCRDKWEILDTATVSFLGQWPSSLQQHIAVFPHWPIYDLWHTVQGGNESALIL